MKEQFLKAMSKNANSVCVVATDGVGGRAGVTVSAMASVSTDTPLPTLLVCIHKHSPICKAIQENQVFSTNVLKFEQAHVSDSFAGRTEASGEEKFNCASWKTGETGSPLLEGAMANFDCRLVEDIFIGSHHVFVGEAGGIECAEDGSPLLHCDREYAQLAQS